jgi:hypothetical protein
MYGYPFDQKLEQVEYRERKPFEALELSVFQLTVPVPVLLEYRDFTGTGQPILPERPDEMTVQVSPESQAVPSTQVQPPTAKPGPVFDATPAPLSSLEPSAARLLAVLTKIESAGQTVAGYLASLQAQREALSVEIAEVESFQGLSDKFVPRTPSGRKRRVDAVQPRRKRTKAATTTPATPEAKP